MRLKMLIATEDKAYAEIVSSYISEYYNSMIDVCVCSTLQNLQHVLKSKKFDVALMDFIFLKNINPGDIQLPFVLCSDDNTADIPESATVVVKYQRISSITSIVLEEFSKISKMKHDFNIRSSNVTAVWSPSGGVGKTTVSLAYAATKALDGREVFYLNLESFSSIPTYFDEGGKSISSVFEMLDNNEGDVRMLIQGICSRDNGITYLSSPSNYADMNVLSIKNINDLISACNGLADELIIDLSCEFNARTQQIFESADQILIVTDATKSATAKLSQFLHQNNGFESIRDKAALVVNKGASVDDAISSLFENAPTYLPFSPCDDETSLYRELYAKGTRNDRS